MVPMVRGHVLVEMCDLATKVVPEPTEEPEVTFLPGDLSLFNSFDSARGPALSARCSWPRGRQAAPQGNPSPHTETVPAVQPERLLPCWPPTLARDLVADQESVPTSGVQSPAQGRTVIARAVLTCLRAGGGELSLPLGQRAVGCFSLRLLGCADLLDALYRLRGVERL